MGRMAGAVAFTQAVMPTRRIAHLDMDAFYASVELLRYPQLRGLPLVIGGSPMAQDLAMRQQYAALPLGDIPVDAFARLHHYQGRGVITTANYAARAFGVGSAMGLMKAAKLCPQAILLPVDFAEYKRLSRLFKSVIADIAPCMEDRGVDEVYIDFSAVPGGQRAGGAALAKVLQRSILDATGLTCSVGIAPNKLLAKMASEFNKPNGIAVVYEADLQSQIWPLAVRKINGIGPKTGDRLAALGVQTIGDLAALSPEILHQHFGQKTADWLHASAWGRDDRPVETATEPVNLSRETTFERDLHAVHDRVELGEIFTHLCQRVAADLQRQGLQGRTIGIKLRYADFAIATRDNTIALPTNDAAVIRQAAGQALKRVDLSRRVRLLGVRVGKLSPAGEVLAEATPMPYTPEFAGF
jgi:DNA polymerase-4